MQPKKKILFVITKGSPFGGAQRYVYDLATNLPADQFEVVVACGSAFAKASADKEGNSLKEKLKAANIRVIDLENSQRDISWKKDWRVFKELRKIIGEEKPDVLHLNSSKIGGLGALAGRLARVPKIIFTGHGWAFNENRGFLSKTVIIFLHWLTIMLCHQTIAVSEKTKGDVTWLPFIKNKIKVIYNGIGDFDPPAGGVSREEARKFFGTKENQTLIFSLSELHKNKGLDLAIGAIAELPAKKKGQVLYCIAGTGQEKEGLEKQIKDLKLEQQVKLLGFVENGKKYLAGADIFLLPSRTEALPYALLEAGAASLPIIACRVGGIPEIIQDKQNGLLVQPGDDKEIAQAISSLLDFPAEAEQLAENIKKTISQKFSLEQMISKTVELYSLT